MAIIDTKVNSIGTYLYEGPYYVPIYQREYSWIVGEQIQEFWDDLQNEVEQNLNKQKEGPKKYFFGQILIHNDTNEEKKYLIDGQQRTATSVILLSAIRSVFKEIANSPEVSQRIAQAALDMASDITTQNIGRYSYMQQNLKLNLNEIDQEFFENYIQKEHSETSEGIQVKKGTNSHNLIKGAFDFLKFELQKIIKNIDAEEEKFEILKKYYDVFTQKFQIIYTEIDNLEEAYNLFERLNARGKELETSELLKNYLFSLCTNSKSIEKIRKNWSQMLENLEEIDSTKFIRHYWNAVHEFSREKELYRKIKKEKKQPEKFVEELNELSEMYREINNENCTYFDSKELNNILKSLKIMNATTFYPIVIALVREKYSEKDMISILSSIETLILRNIVVCGKSPTRNEPKFANIAKNITKKIHSTTDEICQELSNEIVSDEEFETAFNDFQSKNTKIVRYILSKIATHQEKEIMINEDSNLVHVEHILPKKSGEWIDKLAWIDEEDCSNYVNKLGNLTLLGSEFNRKISNKIFPEKKKTYAKSKINISRELIDFSEWNKDTILHRQSEFANLAKEIWKK